MFVCLCQAVTDSAVEDAIAHGASTVEEIAQACGAGDRCRGCWPALTEMLKASRSMAAVG